jgi:GSH-dependent disulfide-bond oxidoreductase
MIDAYVWTTPNGFKALIGLEELGLPYQPKWIDITKGDQTTPEFLAVNPNNKIPAIVDPEGPDGKPITVFESGAVLTYLADKAGKLIPKAGAARYTVLEWLFFNAGGTGPMLGQLGYFTKFAQEKVPHAIERFTKEADRLFKVLDKRFGESKYIAGDDFTIADVMNFTWPNAARGFLGFDVSPYPNMVRWLDEVAARPAVQKALALKKPA